MGIGDADDAPRDDKLAEAVDQLHRRLAALEMKELLPKTAEPARAQPQHAGAQDPVDMAAMRRRDLERAAAIAGALQIEARDAAWAPATELQLQTAVASAVREAGAQFSVKSVKCLTSICEMVLSAPKREQLDSTELAIAPHITGMGSLDIAPPETAADGSATVTYRLFRQGHPRPDEGT